MFLCKFFKIWLNQIDCEFFELIAICDFTLDCEFFELIATCGFTLDSG